MPLALSSFWRLGLAAFYLCVSLQITSLLRTSAYGPRLMLCLALLIAPAARHPGVRVGVTAHPKKGIVTRHGSMICVHNLEARFAIADLIGKPRTLVVVPSTVLIALMAREETKANARIDPREERHPEAVVAADHVVGDADRNVAAMQVHIVASARGSV